MANAFSKEEIVAFEDVLEGFNDALVISKLVNVYRGDDSTMERAGNTIWRPQPYIAQSFAGLDQTANFKDSTQLSVPATLGFSRSVPFTLSDLELRDQLQEKRLGTAAKQKLASDINLAVLNVISAQGTIVVKRTVAPTGFDDVAEIDSRLNEEGVNQFDRYLALGSRAYNGMAGNLAGRQTLQAPKTLTAYEKAYVGNVSGFETFKMDYATRLPAATGSGVTINGANQYYTPKAISQATTGETNNVDNRFQTISITVTSGAVRAGDAFTLTGVNSVHHITKGDTGQSKTFRIIQQFTGTAGATGTYQISPPIISGQGGTDAELAYQNVTATPANGATLTFLNTANASINPFWQGGAIELLAGNFATPIDAGTQVLRATTDQGIQIVMEKGHDINTKRNKYRFDVFFGVVNLQPEMSGIILFNQV